MAEEGEFARKLLGALVTRGVDALSKRGHTRNSVDPDETVKLVHTRDLASAGRLPRYQDHAGTSLAEFKRQRRLLREAESTCKGLIEARAVITAKDTSEPVGAGEIDVTIPRSFLRGEVSVPMPALGFATAIPHWPEGRIADGLLWARGGWRERQARLLLSCASREKYASELALARSRLEAATPTEQASLEQMQTSPYCAPVLFISHRWRADHHPDPEGETLRRLLELGDAFLIVDYCSFPQPPFAPGESRELDLILRRMGDLMCNVVVMYSADYLSRGWCVYEYLCACLKRTLVCDEIQDERFVDLQGWAHTKAPPPADLFRDGVAGLKTNFIQESILKCINRLLPQFREAGYTLDTDRVRVRGMLRDELLETLPARRIHEPYLSETLSKPWKAAELDRAFDSELTWEEMDTSSTEQFDVSIARSLDEGRRRRFRTSAARSSDYETWRVLSSVGKWFADSSVVHGPHDLGAIDIH